MRRSVRIASLLVQQRERPELTEHATMFLATNFVWERPLVKELYLAAEQRQILPAFSAISLEAAFVPVVQMLERIGVACALTGSLARSIYGMQRTHLQVDVLADLENADVAALQDLLPPAFYVRSADIQTALSGLLNTMGTALDALPAMARSPSLLCFLHLMLHHRILSRDQIIRSGSPNSRAVRSGALRQRVSSLSFLSAR